MDNTITLVCHILGKVIILGSIKAHESLLAREQMPLFVDRCVRLSTCSKTSTRYCHFVGCIYVVDDALLI